MKKRTIALLLAAVMLFAMIPVVAQAEYYGNGNVSATWSRDTYGWGLQVNLSGSDNAYLGDWSYNSGNNALVISSQGIVDQYVLSDIKQQITDYMTYAMDPANEQQIQMEGGYDYNWNDAEQLYRNNLEQFPSNISSLELECTGIGASTFSGLSSLSDVQIRNSYSWSSSENFIIGESAFENCSNLNHVWLDDSMPSIEIGARAFANCGLPSVGFTDDMWNAGYGMNIPSNVTSIGDYAFSGSAITEVDIESAESVSFGEGVFSYCGSLGSVKLPDGITSIPNSMFSGTNLDTFTIPDSVTSIGDYAFNWCQSLTSVTIPDSVTSIGEGTFRDCYALTEITIPDSVTTIGSEAFSGASLSSITIPSSVTSIGSNAFGGFENYNTGEPWADNTITIKADKKSKWDAFVAQFKSEGATDAMIVPWVGATGVSLDKDTMEMMKGSTGTLTATISPENAQDKSVTWSSDNTAVATVDANGVVTGVLGGNATITATTDDNHLTASCVVTVIAPATSLTLDKAAIKLIAGKTSTLTATVGPEDASNKNVLWTSSDETVATVANGVVTGVQPGSATITATSEDGGFTATCAVTVQQVPDATILGMNGYFADYFVLNLYVQTDVENPTFAITRSVGDGEVVQVYNRTDFCMANKAVFYVEKVANKGTNKLGLKSTRSEDCYMVSIKFFVKYLNDPVTIQVLDGEDALNVQGYVYQTVGTDDVKTEHAYSFLDYLNVMKLWKGNSSGYAKMYNGLKTAAEGANAI